MTATAGQLALFRVPDVRRDRRFRLAVLYREVCLLDNPEEGCYAKNRHFATKFLKCHPATVRGMVAELEACGLVERTIEHGTDRTLRPLVPLQDLFTLWPELAQACASCRRIGGALRAAAQSALKPVRGAMARYTRKPSQAASEGTSAQEVRGFSDGKYAGYSLSQRDSAERETTTDKRQPTTKSTVAAVSSPEASKTGPEAQGEPDKRVQLLSEVLPADEARSIGREARAKDWSEELILGVIAAYTAQRQNIRSAGAWFRAALRNEFKAPLPPATHPSDMKPGSEPIRTALVPVASLERKPAQPSAQPSEGTTQGREYFREKREALTQREATEAPSSLLPDLGKTSASGSGTARPGFEPIRTEQASPSTLEAASTPEVSQSAPLDRWEALDATAQEGLLQKALAELVAGSPGPLAEQLRRRGVSHGLVIARAKLKVEEETAPPPCS